jgi:hypothetical protein
MPFCSGTVQKGYRGQETPPIKMNGHACSLHYLQATIDYTTNGRSSLTAATFETAPLQEQFPTATPGLIDYQTV